MIDIVIIFGCSALGYLVAVIVNKRLLTKELTYWHLYLFANDMNHNVVHEKLTITKYLGRCDKSYCQLIANLIDTKGLYKCGLSNNEQKEVIHFVCGLDANNSKTMIEHLHMYCDVFYHQYNTLHDNNKAVCSVNTKVGLLLGAVLALLLI